MRKKKILIINLPAEDVKINRDMAGGLGYSGGEGVVLPPLELLSIAATLQKNGWEVKVIDALAKKLSGRGWISQEMEDFEPVVVLGNLSLPTVGEDTKFYRWLVKHYPETTVVVKTGITYENILRKVVKQSKVGRVIFGEADLDIEDYIEGKLQSGVAYVEKGKFRYWPIKIRPENLDKLLIPARELVDKNDYAYPLLGRPVTTIQTSRGCPYPCGFYCPYPLVQGTRWRSMTPERVVRELENVISLGYKNVLFRDATLTLDRKRSIEMCQMIIKKKLKFDWWGETRVNVLDKELLKVMKKAGCRGLNVGIESLDKELMETSGKPGVKFEDVVRLRREAKEVGIKLHFLILVGLLDENIASILATLRFLVMLQPDSVGFSVVTPYPGTRMFETAKKEKLISGFDWNRYDGSVGNMNTRKLRWYELELLRKILMVGAWSMRKPRWLGLGVQTGLVILLDLWRWWRRE